MNSFLYAELVNNSFICHINLSIFNNYFTDIKAKLDTGCSYTTINYWKLEHKASKCKQFKKLDIENNVDYMLTYGVESSGFKHTEPETIDEKLECKFIKFKHNVSNFSIDDYTLSNCDVYINYDRRGNILIGMDILSKFDIHIGTSNVTGKEILIAVLKDQQDKNEYYKALYEHFNIVQSNSVLAENIRNTWR
jgi:hypothetical protein